MAINNNKKITGQDIFDQASISSAFAQFEKQTNAAKVSIQELKQEILGLNKAFDDKFFKGYGKQITALTTKMKNLTKKVAELNAAQSANTAQTKINTTAIAGASAAAIAAAAAKAKAAAAEKANSIATSKNTVKTRLATAATYAYAKAKKLLTFANKKLVAVQKLAKQGLVAVALAAGFAAKAIYKTSKEVDTMKLTMRKVTKDTYEMQYAMDFLRKTSSKFGLDLLKTSSKFATFRASAKESNFTLKETMELFETFSNAGASLGKSGAELDRIFLALEQMMSKGKVSSEELRRQLGEVLPGAVAIMAKSMGVSNAELEKMLKNGEVLAEDVLLKFGKQVKDTFSLDNAKKIDTLSAAQNRLTNSFTGFVELAAGEGSSAYSSLSKGLEGLSSIMDYITDIFALFNSDLGEDQIPLVHELRIAWEVVKEVFLGVAGAVIYLGDKIARLLGFGPAMDQFKKELDLVKTINANIKASEENQTAFNKLADTYKLFLDTVEGLSDLEKEAAYIEYIGSAAGLTTEELRVMVDGLEKTMKVLSAPPKNLLKDELTAMQKQYEEFSKSESLGHKKQAGLLKGLFKLTSKNFEQELAKRFKASKDFNEKRIIEEFQTAAKIAAGATAFDAFKEREAEIERHYDNISRLQVTAGTKAAEEYRDKYKEMYGLEHANFQAYVFNKITTAKQVALSIEKVAFFANKLKTEKIEVEEILTSMFDIISQQASDLEEELKSLKLSDLTTPEDIEKIAKMSQELQVLKDVLNELTGGTDLSKYSKEELGTMLDAMENLTPEQRKVIEGLHEIATAAKKGWEAMTNSDKAIMILGTIGDILGAISAVGDANHEKKMAQLDEEQSASDSYYDNQLKAAEGDAEAQDKIRIRQAENNRKLEKKKKKAEYENAKRKKKIALVEIAINTGVAVIQAFAQLGPIAGAIFGGIITAIGIAQAIAVKKQPLPKYALGTSNHPGGAAMLGDGGKNELAISPTGGLYVSGNTPEIVSMEKGTRVLPNAQKYIQEQVMKSIIQNEQRKDDNLVERIAEAVTKGLSRTKFTNNTNIEVGIDHALWRNNAVMGDS